MHIRCRTVQSSAGTLVDAWRWKCPKMPTLVFVWWSRDAPDRSGWYETGLSIPGTEARIQPLRQFGQRFKSRLDLKLWTIQRRGGTGGAGVWYFAPHTQFTELPSSHRAFQHRVLKEEYDEFMCITETLWRAGLLHIACRRDIQLHVQLRAAWKAGNLFPFYCETIRSWKMRKSVRVCFLLFFWVHLSKSEKIIAIKCHIKMIILGCDLENCCGQIVLPWQNLKLAAEGRIGMHFTWTHTSHYSSLFLWTVLLTEDRSNHVPFSSCFCFIWPGNVSPKSMYKLIWKLLIYKQCIKQSTDSNIL